jgi:ATP-dependent DNA ligase
VQYEEKWDRYRLLAFNTDRRFLQSRRGANLTAAFPEIVAAVSGLPPCVLDGEVVIWGPGTLGFPALLQPIAARGAKAGRLAALRPANYGGIEGIIARGLEQPYRGGARDWLKYRYLAAVAVVLGAVTVSITTPDRLILGLCHDGVLRIVGGTSALTTAHQRTLSHLLVAAGEDILARRRWRAHRLWGRRRCGGRACRA